MKSCCSYSHVSSSSVEASQRLDIAREELSGLGPPVVRTFSPLPSAPLHDAFVYAVYKPCPEEFTMYVIYIYIREKHI